MKVKQNKKDFWVEVSWRAIRLCKKYNALYFALTYTSLRSAQARAKCAPSGICFSFPIMKAICRVAKVKGSGSISGKSDHNYRLGHVPNADPDRQYLNQEYVNTYSRLGPAIEERLVDAGISKTRQDAVKGMEFILTASPERFKRDATGQALGDYREHPWVKANLEFMQQKYGPNLVAFTLHQDEKTPHIHAVVVPITADGRLCAKELFTPRTLRELQTDYAQAMKSFGLERGIEGSRAKHVEMKHIYGLQQQERLAIQQELAPIQQPQQPLQIEQPGMLDLLNLERWKQQQEAQINAEYNRRLSELQKLAQKAQNMAVANATVKEQGKLLQQRLNTTESLKQANFEKAQQASQQLEKANQTIDRIAILTHEQRLSPEWSQQKAQQVQERVLPQLERDVVASVQQITTSEPTQALQQLQRSLEERGYQFGRNQENKISRLIDPKSEVQVHLPSGQFEGKSLKELFDQRLKMVKQQELKQGQRQGRGLGLWSPARTVGVAYA